MKIINLYTLIIIALSAIVSCSKDKDTFYPDLEKIIIASRELDYYAADSLVNQLKYEDSDEYRAQLALALLEKSLLDTDHSHNDSLINEAENYYLINKPTSNKYANLLYFKSLELFENGFYAKAAQYVCDGIEIAQKHNNHVTLGELYKLNAALLYYQDDTNELYKYDMLSLKEFTLAHDTIGIVSAYGNLYVSNPQSNNYNIALAYLDTADTYCKRANLKHRKIDIDIKRMFCYVMLGNIEKAESMFKDSIKANPTTLNEYYTVGSWIYNLKNEYNKSIDLYQKMYDLADIGNEKLRSTCYREIGEQYYKLSDYDKAFDYLIKGYDDIEKTYKKYTAKSAYIASKIYNSEVLEEKIKNKDTRQMLFVSIGFCLISFLLYVIVRIRFAKQKEVLKANQRIRSITQEMGQKFEEYETKIAEINESKSQVQDAAKELLAKKVLLIEKVNLDEVISDVDKIYDMYATKVNNLSVLSDKDKKFCILYKSGMQPKVIAMLMDCSTTRVYSRKADIIAKAKDIDFALFDS